MKSVRTPGIVELLISSVSAIMLGKSPATDDAVTPISFAFGAALGPVNAYVNVGSSPVP